MINWLVKRSRLYKELMAELHSMEKVLYMSNDELWAEHRENDKLRKKLSDCLTKEENRVNPRDWD